MRQYWQEQQQQQQKFNKCFTNKFDGILMPLRMQYILYSINFKMTELKQLKCYWIYATLGGCCIVKTFTLIAVCGFTIAATATAAVGAVIALDFVVFTVVFSAGTYFILYLSPRHYMLIMFTRTSQHLSAIVKWFWFWTEWERKRKLDCAFWIFCKVAMISANSSIWFYCMVFLLAGWLI